MLIYSFTVSKTLLTYFVIEHFLGTVLMYVFVYYADMYLSWYEYDAYVQSIFMVLYHKYWFYY